MEWEPFRAWCRPACGLAALVVLCAAGSTRAAKLAWHAPTECATDVEVIDQVERLTGRRLSAIDTVDFEAHVERDGPSGRVDSSRWVLRLTTVERSDGNRRQREIEAGTCWEIRDAAVVAIAMAVRAEPLPAVEEAAPVERKPARPDDPAALPEADSLPRRSGAANRNRRMRVAVGLGGVVDAGTLPGPALGAALEGVVGFGRARVVLLGATFAPSRKMLDEGSGGEFRLHLLGGLGCFEPALGAWNGLACGGFEVGQLVAQGVGDAVVSHTAIMTWKAGRLEIGAVSPNPEHLHLVVRLGAVVPLATPDFVIDARRRVHTPDTIVARLSLGVELPL